MAAAEFLIYDSVDESPDSDFTIYVWRQKSTTPSSEQWPILHVRDPDEPLPAPPAYRNESFYMFRSKPASSPPLRSSSSSVQSGRKARNHSKDLKRQDDVPKYKQEFEKFHSENGVRTIVGSIGPVQSGMPYCPFCNMPSIMKPALIVRMLLKSGYRHVYISRKFAIQHGFIPADAAPGHYGYGGLVKYVLLMFDTRVRG